MAVVLTVEDGTGLANANSYVDVATATAYFEARVPTSASAAWTAALIAGSPVDDSVQKAALISATRFGDAYVRTRLGGYRGTRMTSNQALAWPRGYCPDPDPINLALDPAYVGSIDSPQYLAADAVPRAVVEFTCELALTLLSSDLVAVRAGEGISSVSAGPAGVSVVFATSFAAFAKTVAPYAVDLVRPLTVQASGVGASSIRRVA